MQSIRDIFRLRSTFCIHRCWMTVIPQSESLVSGLDNSFCGGVMNYVRALPKHSNMEKI